MTGSAGCASSTSNRSSPGADVESPGTIQTECAQNVGEQTSPGGHWFTARRPNVFTVPAFAQSFPARASERAYVSKRANHALPCLARIVRCALRREFGCD